MKKLIMLSIFALSSGIAMGMNSAPKPPVSACQSKGCGRSFSSPSAPAYPVNQGHALQQSITERLKSTKAGLSQLKQSSQANTTQGKNEIKELSGLVTALEKDIAAHNSM